MTTKEKIIDTALQLFNKQGIDPVTTRHIAKEMNISHGNLCYHYSKKEDIIGQLYHNLVAELDQEIAAIQSGVPSLEMLMQATAATFRIQYKYKFILQDMVAIMRKIEPIGQHFKVLYQQRKNQFRLIIQYLLMQGLIESEKVKGQYDNFIDQFYIIGDFWVSEAEILFDGPDEEKLAHYTQLAFSLIIPYFTPKGLEAYQYLQKAHQKD
ncbi:TetR/AcrR family transcriptional regulator [Rhodocytophaga aerolata]|uniref:TetR/AcrR family transcriptional regulator n=1 Tax=Rhodocytophaga aerolata TaxID=455078 RepID=A0ABT8RAG0_9BACT|nr:TetR/AcrR family transcriptional regulator [Rhodocytophaga aerolata]MDO1449088.1 TetR/AcrR family transcriptional regulator [Rhodocytophaga aerolata]